ncbi:MAG: hypothetical protein ACYC09_04505 [Bacteroidota bacterium]
MNTSTEKRFQWTWVWISLAMYLFLYFLPLSLMPGGILNGRPITGLSSLFIGIWSLGGMFIVSALAGYMSTGVTIKEPAVAALILMFLWFFAVQFRFHGSIHNTTQSYFILLVALSMIGILSVAGAWWGEQMQKAAKMKQ